MISIMMCKIRKKGMDQDCDGEVPAKKARRECKYQQEWKTNRISPSSRGNSYAHCEYCNADFNIGHGGLNDVKKHLATTKHQQCLNAASNTKELKKFLKNSQSPIEEAVTRAEILFAEFVAEHNLSFSVAHHFYTSYFGNVH